MQMINQFGVKMYQRFTIKSQINIGQIAINITELIKA